VSSIDAGKMVGVVVGLSRVDVVLVMLVWVVVCGDGEVVVLVIFGDVRVGDALTVLGGSINDCIDIT
jgi:hypothetical protein